MSMIPPTQHKDCPPRGTNYFGEVCGCCCHSMPGVCHIVACCSGDEINFFDETGQEWAKRPYPLTAEEWMEWYLMGEDGDEGQEPEF